MDEQPQPLPKTRIILFDEYGKPLVVSRPPQKQPIGFINWSEPPSKNNPSDEL
jgi:hypothetical protein